MATVGLRDLFYATITETAEGVESYGTPKRLAKAISAEMSVEVAEAILHGDDGVDVVEREFVSGELTLNTTDLDQADVATLLGQQQDADGVNYASGDDIAPYVAIAFRAKKPGGKFKYVWLYKVKFGVPDESYQTKGDSIEFSTPEIVGTIIKRDDGLWKADHVALPTDPVAEAWYEAVREPNNTPESGG